MSLRKRPRASLNLTKDNDDDEELDELSPRKSDLQISSRRTSSSKSQAKKRRLNTYGSSPAGGIRTNGSSGGVLAEIRKTAGSLLGGIFGSSDGEMRNGSAGGGEGSGDETVDELAAEQEENDMQESRNGNRRSSSRVNIARKDVYDLPSSGDEDQQSVRKVGGVKKRGSIRSLNGFRGGKNRKSAEMEKGDVWDVPDSDEEVTEKTVRSSAGKKKPMANGSASSKIGSVRTGSSRKQQKDTQPLEDEDDLGNGIEVDTSTRKPPGRRKKVSSPSPESNDELATATSAQRTSGRARTVSSRMLDALEQGGNDPLSEQNSFRKAGANKSVHSASPAPTQPVQPRKRGRPRKVLDEVIQDAKQATPKGILTPSKGRTLKSKKSVAFDNHSDGIDLGFKDIPSSATSKNSKKIQNSVPQEEDAPSAQHDPDAACGVCSKKRARKGNEMLLCDGCDFAVHLKCYGLAEVPDGDWFCKTCRPEDYSAAEEEGEDAEEEETAADDQQDEESKDDTACAICSGLESKVGNKMILCDGCNFAVHVKCYELPEFPKGEWFCRTCLAAAGEDPFNLGIEPEVVVEESQGDVPYIAGIETHLKRAQRVVLDKLTGQRRVTLTGHDDELQKVHQVVEQTVLAGEGNSMLVIGARGCGKTTLVETVISDLSMDHREKFHVVRLNGFIHTDDKIASKEIWRQLGREMEVEDDKPSNYADTLASLLALLSHPSEHLGVDVEQIAKSVVFILDEFDLFTTHSRQTLLYNLFDIAQARKAPIVVLGLTTKIEVVESLEKRVKSRFSHRYVHLSLPRNVPAFWDICKQGASLNEEELGDEDENLGQAEFISFWNSMIEDLYTKDIVFKHHLQACFHRSKSVPAFFVSLLLPIANLTSTTLPLTGKSITSSTKLPSLQPPDSKLHLLSSLSQLSLALLISACRLDIIHDTDTCNFAMAYDEYCALTSRHKIQTSASGVNAVGSAAKVWGREVAIGEWERLSDVGLLVPVAFGGSGGGAGARDGGKAGRMWRVDVGLEEIEGSVADLGTVMAKWCREI